MSRVRVGLALLVAFLPLLWLWTAITRDSSALLLAGWFAFAVLGCGIVVRLLRGREWVVDIVQCVVLAGLALWFVGSFGGLMSLPSLVAAGVGHLASEQAPVSPHAGVTLLLCLGIGALALLADALVVRLRRPALAAAPLLALLLVPTLGPKMHRLSTPGLILFGAGLALVLFAGGRLTFRPGRGGLIARLGAWATVGLATASALVLTLAVAPHVPIPPSTRGPSGDPIMMGDISVDMKRNITQGQDSPAFDYTTTGVRGAYLRLYSLPVVNAAGWQLTGSTITTGRIAEAPGLRHPGTPRTTRVTITGLRSEYLPAPYAPRSHTAGDSWGYLTDSLAILALAIPGRLTATEGLGYTVESVDANPTEAELNAAPAGVIPSDAAVTAAVPSDLPASIVDLTASVTRDAHTPGAKALAILGYLKSPQFTYSLKPAPGTGYQTIESFLLHDHAGYCEQYAASMAIMARAAGIPSRVAIGFAPGTLAGDHWSVTMHDMHSWPELYFDGWGWVSFEPTPSGGPGQGGAGQGDAGQGDAGSASPAPSAGTSSASPAPSASSQSTAGRGPSSAAPSSGGSPWLLLGLLVVSALGLIAPGQLRKRRRGLRLASGRDPGVMALDAWDDVRDTALDYGRDSGRGWPNGSPRAAVESVVAWVHDPALSEGLRALALSTELALFGGPDHQPSARDWRPVVQGFADALEQASAPGWPRVRGRWLPASVLRRPW